MIRTITEGSTAEFTVQRSRFIACTASVKTEEEAQAFLTAQKKKYYDARHHCSAWILGRDGAKQKASDDGEPSGTAGAPILDILKHGGFTDSITGNCDSRRCAFDIHSPSFMPGPQNICPFHRNYTDGLRCALFLQCKAGGA